MKNFIGHSFFIIVFTDCLMNLLDGFNNFRSKSNFHGLITLKANPLTKAEYSSISYLQIFGNFIDGIMNYFIRILQDIICYFLFLLTKPSIIRSYLSQTVLRHNLFSSL